MRALCLPLSLSLSLPRNVAIFSPRRRQVRSVAAATAADSKSEQTHSLLPQQVVITSGRRFPPTLIEWTCSDWPRRPFRDLARSLAAGKRSN